MSRPRCSECHRVLPFAFHEESGDIPTGAIQALAPHMGTLLKLAEEYDIESAGETYPGVALIDSVALTVKASLDGKYEKPAGQPGRIGQKQKPRSKAA
jgi:hypothetical protein